MINTKIGVLSTIPFGMSLLVAFAIDRGWITNYVWIAQLSVDTVGITTRLGLLLTISLFGGIMLIQWYRQKIETTIHLAHDESAKNHKLFVQRLDHEIKNPLTILNLGVVNLFNHQDLGETEIQSLERMQTQVQRLSQLVRDLRALTDLEDFELERSSVDLKSVMEHVIESVTLNQKSPPNINLTIQKVPWTVGYIVGDADLLSIVFINLLNNAIKFTLDSGNIEVKLTDNSQFAIIEIADNGIGIPQSEVGRVFEELYRASNAGRIHGSGMGLSLVRRIVQLHQGEITIHSREGYGTSVAIQLPLANRA